MRIDAGPSIERSSGASGIVRLFLVLALGAGLLTLVVRNGLIASAAGRDDPIAAYRVAPESSVALAGIADLAFRGGDYQRARAYADAAISANPMDGHSTMILALSDAALGDPASVKALIGRAASLGWRDTTTQLALVRVAAASNQRDLLIQRLDALARLGEQRPMVFGMIRQITQDPAARGLLAERLAQQPDWRFFYLNDLRDLPPALAQDHAALLRAMSTTVVPASRGEIASFVASALAANDPARARAIWIALAPRDGAISPTGLYDGALRTDFDSSAHFPFEWTLLPEADAAIEHDTKGGAGVLHVRSQGNQALPLVAQLLALSPGEHGFMAEMRGSSPEGFGWHLRCGTAGHDLPITQTIANGPDHDWRRLAVTLAVPADCPVQTIELRAEQLTPIRDVEMWYRSLAIDPA